MQNPSRTYNLAGTYDVSLTITGPGGSDTKTIVGYVTVASPPGPGFSDQSFEMQTAGSAPATPWTVTSGSGHVINPAGGSTSDNGMPSDGSQWCEISADGTSGSTPPSNPGGATTPPSGGAGVSQSFSYTSGQTILEFEATFLRSEAALYCFGAQMEQ